MCVWVPSALPVKTSAEVTLDDPLKIGTPAGQVFEPPGTPVIVCVAVVTTFPAAAPCFVATIVWAVTPSVLTVPVKTGVAAGHAIVPSGVTVPVLFVPDGVPALTAELTTLFPLKLPVGVMVVDPPVVPTSPCAASVPTSICPSNAATSLVPTGHVPLIAMPMKPTGNALLPPELFRTDTSVHVLSAVQRYRPTVEDVL